MKIEINGVIKDHKEWAKEHNVPPDTILTRRRRGWTGEKLIIPPLTKSQVARIGKRNSYWSGFSLKKAT